MAEPTASELREESRHLRAAACKEINLEIKRTLALRALELAQRAEEIERKKRSSDAT